MVCEEAVCMIQAGKPQSIKVHNTYLIRSVLIQRGPMTKPELAHITHLSLPTVNRIVDELVESSFASETQGQDLQKTGRPAKTYMANKNYSAYVGLYYQDGMWTALRANFLGEIEERKDFPALRNNALQDSVSSKEFSPDEKSGQLGRLISAIREMIGSRDNVRVVALGIPGVVQHDGMITGIPQLPGLEGVNLERMLREELHLPVIVENDVKLKTLGYHSDYLQNLDSVVFLYIGSGIGAGLILDGRLYKGMSNFAGEFGFMPDGAGGMEKKLISLRERLKKEPEDKTARKKTEEILARMLVNVITVINPQAVVIDSRYLQDESLNKITKLISRSIPSGCLPELLIAEGRPYEETGLVQLCGEYYRNHTEEWLAI